jgi:hypothetical protein
LGVANIIDNFFKRAPLPDMCTLAWLYPKVPIVIMERSQFFLIPLLKPKFTGTDSDDFALRRKPYIRPSPRLSSPRFWSNGTVEGKLSITNFKLYFVQFANTYRRFIA